MSISHALELWRGVPLADLHSQWVVRVRQGWLQQYLEAVVAWSLSCLKTGDPGAVLLRLAELAGEYPTAESLQAAYMRALCAAARPADALRHYAVVRRCLAEDLGADPSPQLQQLYRRILAADPALTTPAATHLRAA